MIIIIGHQLYWIQLILDVISKIHIDAWTNLSTSVLNL